MSFNFDLVMKKRGFNFRLGKIKRLQYFYFSTKLLEVFNRFLQNFFVNIIRCFRVPNFN